VAVFEADHILSRQDPSEATLLRQKLKLLKNRIEFLVLRRTSRASRNFGSSRKGVSRLQISIFDASKHNVSDKALSRRLVVRKPAANALPLNQQPPNAKTAHS
jgi:hypothetical protein